MPIYKVGRADYLSITIKEYYIMAQVQVKALTQDSIKAFLIGVLEDEAKAASKRLTVFTNAAQNTDIATFKIECKELAKANADNQTMVQRISEARQLFGAIRFTGFVPENVSYHDAIAQARKALAEKGIKYDGSAVATPEERQHKEAAKFKAKAATVLAKDFDWSQKNATSVYAEVLVDKAAELEQQALEQRAEKQKDAIAKMAAEIVTKYGEEFAVEFAHYIEQMHQENKLVAIAA
jgi:hypothetical protein